jgi:hypothetical protein
MVTSFPVKTLLFCVLLLSPLFIKAQTDNDSGAIIEEKKVDSTDQGGYTNEHEIAGPHDHFLKKGQSIEENLDIQPRKLPDSLVKKMQADDDFWYANSEIEKEKRKEDPAKDNSYTPIGQRGWFQTLLLLVIIGAFAGALMVYLTGSNVRLFRKANKKIDTGEEEMITEDIFAINYQKEIDKAAANGNYRLAVRLMFLRLLKNMSERNIIQYKQDKTNLDYLLQLHPTRYYNNFFRITRNYEYSWYGQFEVSEEAYRIIRNDFDQFDNELPRH